MCCYGGYLPEVRPPRKREPLKDICCWRFYKSRMSAYEYIASEDPTVAGENVMMQNFLYAILILELMLFYGCIVVPMLFEWERTLLVFVCYFVQMVSVDLITSLMLMRAVHMQFCNCFAIVRCLLGNLRKALIFFVSFIGVYSY